MASTIILLLASAVVIYLSCEWFVNSIEWFGRRFHISETAVGSVLAAFGTALPESAVTFIAVVFGQTTAVKDIGVGAAVGGPLVLSTIAYGVVGLYILAIRRGMSTGQPLTYDRQKLSYDQVWFILIFIAEIAAGNLVFPGKRWLGLVFVAAYGVYAWREMTGTGGQGESRLEPLKFHPGTDQPATSRIVAQTVISLALIYLASQLFVGQLHNLGQYVSLPPVVIALLLSPVATELPETLNAIIWVRQGKDRLALGNISGAMMIQATVPSALGLLFTPWHFNLALNAAAGAAAVSVLYMLWLMRSDRLTARAMSMTFVFYALFALILFHFT